MCPTYFCAIRAQFTTFWTLSWFPRPQIWISSVKNLMHLSFEKSNKQKKSRGQRQSKTHNHHRSESCQACISTFWWLSPTGDHQTFQLTSPLSLLPEKKKPFLNLVWLFFMGFPTFFSTRTSAGAFQGHAIGNSVTTESDSTLLVPAVKSTWSLLIASCKYIVHVLCVGILG